MLEVVSRYALHDGFAFGLGVSGLPILPRPVDRAEVPPQVFCLGFSLCGEHDPRHVHDKGGVVDCHLRALGLLLRVLERFYVMWDCIPLVVHLAHFILEDEDFDIVVAETNFLELVRHRLGEHVGEVL